MAIEKKVFDDGISAGADFSSSTPGTGPQYKALVIAGTIAANNTAYGILQNKPQSGQEAQVRVMGVSKAVAGAAITAGANLSVTTSGYLIAVASGDGVSIGKAREAANSGDIFSATVNFINGAIAT